MTEPKREGSVVRYYCTAGNGMETFLIEEVKKKLSATDVSQMPGKVLFSSSAGIDRVSDLKAAERLFLLLKQDSPLKLSFHTSQAKAASMLQSRLLADRSQWTSAVMIWRRLQGELAASRTTVKTLPTSQGVTRERAEGRGSEEQREEEERCFGGCSKSTGVQREEESGNERLRSGEQNGTQTLEKKRKRDDEKEETVERKSAAAWHCSAEKNVENGKISKRQRETVEEAETGIIMEFSNCAKNGKHGTDFNGKGSVCDHVAPGLEHSGESSRTMDDVTNNSAEENVKTTGQRLPSCAPISFRISCKCTGSLSRCFSTQEVSKVIGVGLSRLLGWNVDLKNPQLEINVYLNDDHCLLGIPLTRLPLANRSYIKTTGLRSTIAWAMTSLAQIQPGFRVVDPMCGVGTILIEAAQEHKAACFLGVDNDDGQLQRANENVAFAQLGNRIHLLKASSMVLPLPSASVDAVICDLPFGKKFGTRVNMASNLPLILAEMERVLCSGGTLVLLLSPQLSCLLKKLLIQKGTGPACNQETKPPTGKHTCSSPSVSPTKQQTSQTHLVVRPSPGQEPDPQHSVTPSLSSLKHQETFRVSLGAIDGIIHKYVKTDA